MNSPLHFIQEIENYTPRSIQEEQDRKIILELIAHYPDSILLRDNALAHITASALILNPALDKVLLIHHRLYRTWSWTGGHADGHGDLLEVAIKEAREETGIRLAKPLTGQLDSLDILPVYGHYRRGSYVSTHLHLSAAYVLIAGEDQSLTVNKAETTGVRWCETSLLAQYSNEPFLLRIYEKLLEKARRYVAKS